jgi:hypothetical protein
LRTGSPTLPILAGSFFPFIGKNLGRGFEGDANPLPDGPPSQFAASVPFATSGLFALPPVVLTAK